MPEQSVDCIVTSPPYAMQRASTYGGIAPDAFPSWTVEWMDAALPLLKPNGSVAINISPHVHQGQLSDYVIRMRLALREAGWLEHDELVWVKPDKMPTGKATWPVRSWEPIYWYSRSKDPYCNATENGNPVSDALRKRIDRRDSPFAGRAGRHGWDHSTAGGGTAPKGERSRGKNWVSIAVRCIGTPGPVPDTTAAVADPVLLPAWWHGPRSIQWLWHNRISCPKDWPQIHRNRRQRRVPGFIFADTTLPTDPGPGRRWIILGHEVQAQPLHQYRERHQPVRQIRAAVGCSRVA